VLEIKIEKAFKKDIAIDKKSVLYNEDDFWEKGNNLL